MPKYKATKEMLELFAAESAYFRAIDSLALAAHREAGQAWALIHRTWPELAQKKLFFDSGTGMIGEAE